MAQFLRTLTGISTKIRFLSTGVERISTVPATKSVVSLPLVTEETSVLKQCISPQVRLRQLMKTTVGDLGGIQGNLISKKIDPNLFPITPKEIEIQDSLFNLRITEKLDPLLNKTEIADPSVVTEKKAARLIVIRRRKMKKHKLKKLRKRMRFEWAKLRLRREQRKEKIFQEELLSQIAAAEAFNAEKWAEDILQRSKVYAKKKQEEEFFKTPEGQKVKHKMIQESLRTKPANWKD